MKRCGIGNIANAFSSTVSGGSWNSANADDSTVGGGNGNTASGPFATLPGGRDALASHYGEITYASGRFAAGGDAQTSVYMPGAEVASNQTVNESSATLQRLRGEASDNES
jgi:trimeric autotransporter adhesin